MTIFDSAKKICLAERTVENWAYGRRPAPEGFPAPVHVGRQLRYIEAEVDAYIAALAAARLGQPALDLRGTATTRRPPGRPRKVLAGSSARGGE